MILEEIAMDDDSPDDVAHRVFGEQLFPDHPLGRDTAGDRDTVQAINADDVRRFFATHYTAGSMVVVARRAASSTTSCCRWSTSAFAACRPRVDGRRSRHAPGAIGGDAARSTTTPSRCTSSSAAARFARGDDDREALDVVNHVLGGGLSSRLFEEIREKSRPRLLRVLRRLGRTPTAARARCTPARSRVTPTRCSTLIRAELDRLVSDGITDDELDIAMGYLTGAFELGLEDTGSRMARNGGLLCTTWRDPSGRRAGGPLGRRRPGGGRAT